MTEKAKEFAELMLQAANTGGVTVIAGIAYNGKQVEGSVNPGSDKLFLRNRITGEVKWTRIPYLGRNQKVMTIPELLEK